MDLAKKFDLTAAASRGADLHLRNPATNEPLYDDEERTSPVTIKLLGKDSPKWREAIHKASQERTANQVRTMTPEERQRENARIFAGITLGWSGIESDGKALRFNEANARSLYLELPWIMEQIDAFVADRANFLT
jgi:hypothetical protein